MPISLTYPAQLAVFGAISVVSFFLPFFLGHPQWLVGTVVNAGLFLSAIFCPCLPAGRQKIFFASVIILPSIGVLARGLVFGSFTWFLIYFLPFIWLGNLILILIFKSLVIARSPQATWQSITEYVHKLWIATPCCSKARNDTGYIFSVLIAAAAKFLFLFLTANIYFKFSIVPALFLQTMGFNQLATALAGGLVAFVIWKIYLKVPRRSL